MSLQVPEPVLAFVTAIFGGWTGYNTRQIDHLKNKQAEHQATVAGLSQKLDDTYTLVKEVREDQKRRTNGSLQDSR